MSPGESVQEKVGRQSDQTAPSDTNIVSNSVIDDVESQMRKALAQMGESPRHRQDSDRMESPSRLGLGDRFGGGLHRRRFVQDGDVPVTVVRRDQQHESLGHRPPPGTPAALPTSSRLQRTEAALAAETAMREKAERALSETQAVVRDLQTKIGHAELAKNEAIDALRREREAGASLRTDHEDWESRLQEAEDRATEAEEQAQAYLDQLDEERRLRKAAEKALRLAEDGREKAEQLVRSLSSRAEVAVPVPVASSAPPAAPVTVAVAAARKPKVSINDALASASVRRHRAAQEVAAEPEPVKWWLNTAATAAKRR